MIRAALTSASLATLVLGVACAPARSQTETLVVDGITRSYRLHVPVRHSAHPSLVIMLHGGGGTAAGTESSLGFDALADREDVIVAYPDGTRRRFNDGRPTTAGLPDDVHFIGTLARLLESRYHTNPQRAYAAGISNGGMMALRLACELPGIAAVGSVAANLPVGFQDKCHPAHPVSLIEISGTKDPLMPFAGGEVTIDRGAVLSAADTVARFRALDECKGPSVVSAIPAGVDGTSATIDASSDCSRGSGVTFVTVIGGGHGWPGANQYLPARFIGIVSQTFDANKMIWEFFARHPRL